MPAWKAAGTSPSRWRVVSVSRFRRDARRWRRCRVSGWGAGSAAGVEATPFQVSASSTTAGVRAYSVSSDAQRWNEVPAAGRAMGCPPWCWDQAMLRSSNRIRQDTASTARWWTISTSWPVPVTHRALSMTPAPGFSRDRAAATASSVSVSTSCRIPGVHRTGLGHRQRPSRPSSSMRSRRMA